MNEFPNYICFHLDDCIITVRLLFANERIYGLAKTFIRIEEEIVTCKRLPHCLLTLMLLAANLANTKGCKKTGK